MTPKPLFALLFLFSFASCRFWGAGERVTGNGHIVSEKYQVGSFSKLEVSGAITVQLKESSDHSVRIETDENLMQYIEVQTVGGELVIRSRDGYNLDPSKDVVAYVSSPVFRAIDASGACDVFAQNIISGDQALDLSVSGSGLIEMEVDVPAVSTSISGSGNINLQGRASSLEASVSGSGDMECFDLFVETGSISISGAGNAQLNVSKQLHVKVSGAGQVQYRGAASVTSDISGAGSVEKAS